MTGNPKTYLIALVLVFTLLMDTAGVLAQSSDFEFARVCAS